VSKIDILRQQEVRSVPYSCKVPYIYLFIITTANTTRTCSSAT